MATAMALQSTLKLLRIKFLVNFLEPRDNKSKTFLLHPKVKLPIHFCRPDCQSVRLFRSDLALLFTKKIVFISNCAMADSEQRNSDDNSNDLLELREDYDAKSKLLPKPAYCSLCDRHYLTQYNLKRHYKRVHWQKTSEGYHKPAGTGDSMPKRQDRE